MSELRLGCSSFQQAHTLVEVSNEELGSLIAGEQPAVAVAHVMLTMISMSAEIKLERERFFEKASVSKNG